MGRESFTPAICAGWTGGAVAALGIGAAILSGAGAAAADTSSGSGTSPSAHSAPRSSAGPAAGAHSARPAKPATSATSTTRSATVPATRSAGVLTSSAITATPTDSPAVSRTSAAKSAVPNPMAMVTSALHSFFRQVQTALTAATRTAAPSTGTTAPRTGPSTWGAPTRTVNFTDASVLSQFVVYTGTHPEGTRTPSALSFSNGTMTITGDAQGNDEGIAWTPGQKYGGWEVRLRVPAGAANYDPVLLLWPDAENWPKGGEVDFMEMWDDPTRQTVNSVLHYGPSNKQIKASVAVDATQWHTYAVKWTPTQITTYVDGVPLFTSTNKSQFPPGAMHLCIQLDTMGPDIAAGAQMEVAWAKQYSLTAVT
ncbi:family 16 glycosylhydrolase [Mycolicibacterium sp. ELW1]|uniref:glycoside hydrolase family 16 protein n=1 Tax=Mycobacteriaceae TaxID=1762 RepID=UPI0011EE75D9|nr:family 16 glycosylhydrolase [Mycobacterium sp. ELW1]QEN15064.1 glycosyl hydrolase family protein [Mycobacterium sp. ELW1]